MPGYRQNPDGSTRAYVYKGFPCPECGKPTKATGFDRRNTGQVSRRRQCTVCEYRFSTIERTAHHEGVYLVSDEDPCPNCDHMKTVLKDIALKARAWS